MADIVSIPWDAYPWDTMPWDEYSGTNGGLRYVDLDGNQGGYIFRKNPDYGHGFAPLDLDDKRRTIDGTLKVYGDVTKRSVKLPFTRVEMSQYDAIYAIWVLRVPVFYYSAISNPQPDFTGYIMMPPAWKSEPAFVNGNWTVSFDLEIQEI